MKVAITSKFPLLLKPFVVSLFLSVAFLLFLALQPPLHRTKSAAVTVSSSSSSDLKIRSRYPTYEDYIKHQLNKTLNPKLQQLWMTRDWDRKVRVFSRCFQSLKDRNFLFNSSKAISIGARVGQEVVALQLIGVNDAIGMDLAPHLPLVVQGDFHNQPFDNATFDFEFSNVFDHALYPSKFVSEIERTLKPGGVCVLHVSLTKSTDRYSANDLYSVDPLVEMFKDSKLVEVRKVDAFGLDTEVVFRKKMKN